MTPTQLGLVVHPSRSLDRVLDTIRDWASKRGASVGQVLLPGQSRRIAEPVAVESSDLVLALGGDGTMLAALHAAAPASRPVLGVACGSVGVLTSVPGDRLPQALERVAAGNWAARPISGLHVAAESGDVGIAINDFTVIRDGTGQLITETTVDGELYARTAGDGLVVATPLGSSAYTIAAGGPILAPGVEGMVITPLAHHGGVCPPLVVAADCRVRVSVEPGHGGSRFELDGQAVAAPAAQLTVTLRSEYATMVTLADQEPRLTSLRRKGLVVDSPRVLARDMRGSSSG